MNKCKITMLSMVCCYSLVDLQVALALSGLGTEEESPKLNNDLHSRAGTSSTSGTSERIRPTHSYAPTRQAM